MKHLHVSNVNRTSGHEDNICVAGCGDTQYFTYNRRGKSGIEAAIVHVMSLVRLYESDEGVVVAFREALPGFDEKMLADPTPLILRKRFAAMKRAYLIVDERKAKEEQRRLRAERESREFVERLKKPMYPGPSKPREVETSNPSSAAKAAHRAVIASAGKGKTNGKKKKH